MTKPIPLYDIARLPASADNCAAALKDLPAGTNISHNETTFSLSHAVLEGHRFAVTPIVENESLLSWGATFGVAKRTISPGDYICNAKVLRELGSRQLDFELPEQPNFSDELDAYHFDHEMFVPAKSLPLSETDQTFLGYKRPGDRGIGTRNDIVILGVNSRVASFVTQLEQMLKPLAKTAEHIDDIVAVAHTEGSYTDGNNQELLLRTLAGFMIHPNVGAVLCVDAGQQGITNQMLKQTMIDLDYPIDAVPHAFLSLDQAFGESLAAGVRIVQGWVDTVNKFERTPQPLSDLKIALQCGGSDAFSGISGNPLAAWVAKQVIRAGGSAVLAETDELNGAEAYVLDKVTSQATAERFLTMLERFEAQVNTLGKSGKGNPSGGNLYRGLYNIYLKSLGAATKRDPEIPLDYAIDYSERFSSPGYYFMDSPGNDLESIAGQVASGCNMIFFVTGNGSITNFPFVPTIKIVTTTERFNLLKEDMDINAGAYLDGTPLPEVGQETLETTISVASGQRSVGERAGHAQVQIWRDWQDPADSVNQHQPTGQPMALRSLEETLDFSADFWRHDNTLSSDRVGLILPTSLCSGQIAQIAVDQLNQVQSSNPNWPRRFVTLVHTEGCGATIQAEFEQTMLGYLRHPMVSHCVLLEHGCESTHNSFWRQKMIEAGYDPDTFGWSSVQLDGGIEQSISKLTDWFASQNENQMSPSPTAAGLKALKLGLVTNGTITHESAAQLGKLTNHIVSAGGTIVALEEDNLLTQTSFIKQLQSNAQLNPTLNFGQPWAIPGLHIMQTPTQQSAENITGIAATGVELIVALSNQAPQAGHPLVPVLNITHDAEIHGRFAGDFDMFWKPESGLDPMAHLLSDVISGHAIPKTVEANNVAFQITRGLTGVSL